MESWLFYAIISIFFAGLFNFTFKIAAERHYNMSVFNICSYAIGILVVLGYWILNPDKIILDNYFILIGLGFFTSLAFFLSTFSRVESMKNIDTVLFFPIYKTVGPIIVTIISLFYFGESLTIKETIGIVVGLLIPILLINSHENKRQKNLLSGVILILITALFTAFTSSMNKEIMLKSYDVAFYMFIVQVFGFLFSNISYFIFRKKKEYNNVGVIKIGIIGGFLHIASFFVFMMAMQGNLAVVFTINSFSILIPIILSIIFYKDHFNLKKAIVLILSIISIILFI